MRTVELVYVEAGGACDNHTAVKIRERKNDEDG
jgi:hypothetical protein